ncbi:hypothetical protein E5163_06455 [Marinicauda algicola]|uniref:Uncharacterized protein n=1 Tax=Marinicauda algicola TaxID=2029849 RepID=A0A4S2GZU7_9PROT|nr:hypothetical protein [Marinicauda algicola]TGY88775.1 hypothetical protein E5163_06455 [Marinicauda algicola]
MKTAIRRDVASVSVCRRIAWIPGQRHAGEAKKAERREGKIKQSGTLSGRFGKKLLSAHWLGLSRTALHFCGHGAVYSRNALDLLALHRHYHLKSAVLSGFRPGRRP